MNFYPFHIGDYLVHTRHLSLMEDLAYRRTLDLYYTRDGNLPESAKDVARLIGMREQETEVAAVLAEFFPGGGNKRADEELVKMKAKRDNARASVAKRHRHASVTQASREHQASVIEASTTNTNTNTKKEKPARKRATPLPEGFAVSERVENWAKERGFFDFDLGKQLEAFTSYAKRKGATYVDWDEALMTAIREDWAKCRVPKPADVARMTVPADPRNDYKPDPPMTPEQREAANKARALAMASLKNITPRAA